MGNICSHGRNISYEEENFTRFCNAILGIATRVLQEQLQTYVPSKDIAFALTSTPHPYLWRRLNQQQKVLISQAANDGYKNFDITLCYTLLRNVCVPTKPIFPKPTRDWGNQPLPTDQSLSDDIERIRILRNEMFCHIANPSIPVAKFTEIWKELKDIFSRMKLHSHGRDFNKEMRKLELCKVKKVQWSSLVNLVQQSRENERAIESHIQRLDVLSVQQQDLQANQYTMNQNLQEASARLDTMNNAVHANSDAIATLNTIVERLGIQIDENKRMLTSTNEEIQRQNLQLEVHVKLDEHDRRPLPMESGFQIGTQYTFESRIHCQQASPTDPKEQIIVSIEESENDRNVLKLNKLLMEQIVKGTLAVELSKCEENKKEELPTEPLRSSMVTRELRLIVQSHIKSQHEIEEKRHTGRTHIQTDSYYGFYEDDNVFEYFEQDEVDEFYYDNDTYDEEGIYVGGCSLEDDGFYQDYDAYDDYDEQEIEDISEDDGFYQDDDTYDEYDVQEIEGIDNGFYDDAYDEYDVQDIEDVQENDGFDKDDDAYDEDEIYENEDIPEDDGFYHDDDAYDGNDIYEDEDISEDDGFYYDDDAYDEDDIYDDDDIPEDDGFYYDDDAYDGNDIYDNEDISEDDGFYYDDDAYDEDDIYDDEDIPEDDGFYYDDDAYDEDDIYDDADIPEDDGFYYYDDAYDVDDVYENEDIPEDDGFYYDDDAYDEYDIYEDEDIPDDEFYNDDDAYDMDDMYEDEDIPEDDGFYYDDDAYDELEDNIHEFEDISEEDGFYYF